MKCNICNSNVKYLYNIVGNKYYKCDCSNGGHNIEYWLEESYQRFTDIMKYIISQGYSIEFVENTCLLHKDYNIIVGITGNYYESLCNACERIHL